MKIADRGVKPIAIPTLEIPQALAGSPGGKTDNLEELALSICAALSNYPHYVIVNDYPPIEDRTNLVNLCKAILAVSSGHNVSEFYSQNKEKVSFTKVRIDRENDTSRGRVTRYSRTHLPLPPHTDSSYMEFPHELVAFQCIVADNKGGESIMIPVEDILPWIDDQVAELLRAPVYPFGDEPYPILSGEKGDEEIRYYRAQIERILEAGAPPLSDEHRAAIETLDAVLQQSDRFSQFHLQPGQIVFMHNNKVLHGRKGFSQESDRLLYRVRLHVDTFDCADQGKPSESENFHLDDANAHMSRAKELKRKGNFNDALKHYRYASELEPNNTDILKSYGNLLIRTGQFGEAAKTFCSALKIAPNDYDSGIALSSLVNFSGKYEKAQVILKHVARCHPYVLEDIPDLHKPTILRIRGFDGCEHGITQKLDGTYTTLLKGGHFSIRDLVDGEKYNWIVLNISENNINELRDIPKFDLLLNTIACPDRAGVSVLTAAKFVDRYPTIPLINDPRRVLETTREENALRLNKIPGVSFPKTKRVSLDGTSLDAIVKEILDWGFVFPFIVREAGSQTGISVAKVNSSEELQEYFQEFPEIKDYYIIQFQDCRNKQNVFNKTRVFFIDGNFYPVANLFDDEWNIHSGDRYSIMDKTPWTQEKEKSFLNDPISYLGTENFEKLCQIRDLIGLDFFGIDFTILQDGTLFIFELNAAMRHNFDHAKNFPYTEPHLKRISDAFDAMLQRRLISNKA